jgi:hypothetical protein
LRVEEKSAAAATTKWEYIVFVLKPHDGEWFLGRINDEASTQQVRWEQVLGEMEAEGWQVVKVPDHKPIFKYTTEAVLKRLIPT